MSLGHMADCIVTQALPASQRLENLEIFGTVIIFVWLSLENPLTDFIDVIHKCAILQSCQQQIKTTLDG